MKSVVVTLSSLVLMVSGCSIGGGLQLGSGSHGSHQDEMFAETLRKKISITMESDVAGKMARTAIVRMVRNVAMHRRAMISQ